MSTNADTTPSTQPRLLVVDDSRLMRRAITKLLNGQYTVTEAEDGEDGWKKLENDNSIQIVISDLSMPNLDGFGLLDRIRGSDKEQINGMPVIVITGAEDDEATKKKAHEHGATDFITKPFDSIQLNARLQTQIAHIQTKQQLSDKSDELEKTATIDPLTKCASKQFFDTQGTKDLSHAKRHQNKLSLIRINLDGFNNVFLKFGRQTSNNILVKIGEILFNNTRNEDTAARIGVSKFAVILPSTDNEGCLLLAERIRAQIEDEPFNHDDTPIPITVSIGVSMPVITQDLAFETMLAEAEKNLATAYDEGGNRVVSTELNEDDTAATQDNIPVLDEAHQVASASEQNDPGMDTALYLLKNNQGNLLEPSLRSLALKALSILEFSNSKLGLGMGDAIESIRQVLLTKVK